MVVEKLKTTQSFIEGTNVDHTHLKTLYQVPHADPAFDDPLPFIQQKLIYFLFYFFIIIFLDFFIIIFFANFFIFYFLNLFKAVQYWTLCI